MVDPATKPLPAIELPAIDAAELARLTRPLVVDLRSPSEFAEDHVPGARNVPLFGDVERALVGTLYRQQSPAAAFDLARDVVVCRVAALVNEIGGLAAWNAPRADLVARVRAMTSGGYARLSSDLLSARVLRPAPDPVVFHCWRGGLRSRSVVALVRGLGLDRATVLLGGYKSYRARVAAELERIAWPRVFVLRGLTGVGKTLVLREMERMRPGWTIDLEGLARHRGSLLGMVGLEPCSQKRFESRLLDRAQAGFPGFVVVEGESRRVGDVVLPRGLWDAMSAGTNVGIEAPLARRVDVLCADYLASDSNRAALARQLAELEAFLTRKHDAVPLATMLESGRERELVELLLERHYDPLYRHGEKGKAHAARFDATDPARAAREIAAWIGAADSLQRRA